MATPVDPPQRILSPGEVLPEAAAPQEEKWRENLNITMMCPECKEFPPNIVEEFSAGDLICGSCGLVLQDRVVDTRSEWRTFTNDNDSRGEDPNRVGDVRYSDALLEGAQLETGIGSGDRSGRSRELHRAQNKAMGEKGTTNLAVAYRQISALCESWHISRTISDSCKLIYKTVEEKKAMKGKKMDAVIAACIFVACRANNNGRSFKEIHRLTRVPKKEIGRTFKALEAFLKTEDPTQFMSTKGVHVKTDESQATAYTKPDQVILRYSSQLSLPVTTANLGITLVAQLNANNALAGRSPLSIAAASIYIAACVTNEPRSPKEIGLVCGVSDGTIRAAYKLIYQEKEKIFDEAWRKEHPTMELDKLPVA
ncbi:cyclin-like protein [Eremomyces bilateralis CBS 781.70]|uniref:Transcription initiation factor IIB n=1 Tax=Eremomyces bilateralis CBS 781.70 TaxID=1392243 RepID=A0A6G1G435_9PEZI|nr:cyclin-like protein [Eremomyces bilateralis CBS 781.70]KAF1812823.1 cyclin-like protein [Eremomyces bilateralis CBS 781.70]